jgi:hypothetical protein
MKKLLALAFGVFLAASAAPALANSPIEFEGYVKVYHESLSNFQRNYDGDNFDRENFFENKIQLDITFIPEDNIKIHWQIRGPNYQRWGVQNIDGVNTNATDATRIFTRALWAEVEFPWGTIQAGRIVEGNPGTAGGLASLGYTPSWGSEFLYLNPFDSGDPLDSITFQKDFGNGFALAAYYGKQKSFWGEGPYTSELDPWVNGPPYYIRPIAVDGGFKDNDSDIFGIQGTYQWDDGGFALGVSYVRDVADAFLESAYHIYINPAFVQSFQGDWGEFAIHFEGKYGFGEFVYSKYFVYRDPNVNVNGTMKSKGLGLYLDGVWTYGDGAGDITLASWYVSGSDWNNPNNVRTPEDSLSTGINSLVSLGDFAPFLVAHNGVTLGNGTFSNIFGGSVYVYDQDYIANFPCRMSTPRETYTPDINCWLDNALKNQFGLAILGNHKITPEIAVNYGIGYFRLVEPVVWWMLTRTAADPGWQPQSKELGWEIDLGFTFQLYEHLSFETQFGYMFNGDAYAIYVENPTDSSQLGTWHDPKDTFAWANVIAFTF